MDRIKEVILMSGYLLIASGCGLTESKYIDYSEGEAEGEGDGSGECEAGIAAFAAQIQPVASANCATGGCHATQAIKGKPLIANDAATNRTQLLAYSEGSADTLFNKISSAGHGGRDQSAALPKAKIEAWLSEEATCQ